MRTAIVGGDVTAMRAREAFLAYRDLVRQGRATEDDETLMRSYRAISQGRRILDLRETLKGAGLDEKFRPRLAISRADQARVVFMHHSQFRRHQTWCYSAPISEKGNGNPSFNDARALAVNAGIYPALDGQSYLPDVAGERAYRSKLEAAVPPIPAQFRPQGALSWFHILWDVEWEPIPPRDPILLRRIGGYLYAVVAQWDLTDLERAVLGARLS